MEEYAIKGVEHDIKCDPNGKKFIVFNFVIAYIDAHVPAKIIEEKKVDKIMDYLNKKNNLFIA
ncbi:MAG: hypothetical protein K8S27_09725 [Candidatus Omnitrophica bacterium]|nr:hypothetical protein [Candidatus Omnitrophota bacterium]